MELATPTTPPPPPSVLVKDAVFDSVPERIPKPALKWVGGKTQILRRVLGEFPVQMNDYIEPFLGGGSVLLAVLAYRKSGSLTISGAVRARDANAPLIGLYKNIQSDHARLYKTVQAILAEFDACRDEAVDRKAETLDSAQGARESYYYWARRRYNALSDAEKTGVLGSALFVFLNKTCFRGVFRVGPSGFNVPYGHNKNPEVANLDHLAELSALFEGVEFAHADFAVALAGAKAGDVAYLDPPYAPEVAGSFVGYTKGGFGPAQHDALFEAMRGMAVKGTRALMSNADVPAVRAAFPEGGFSIESIECKRAINSKNPGAKTQEVLVRNYSASAADAPPEHSSEAELLAGMAELRL